MLIYLLLLRYLFSIDIPAVIDTIALFARRALYSSVGRPIFLYALSRVLTRLITRFYLSR
jgi:hypothetical protein